MVRMGSGRVESTSAAAVEAAQPVFLQILVVDELEGNGRAAALFGLLQGTRLQRRVQLASRASWEIAERGLGQRQQEIRAITGIGGEVR